MNPGEEIKVLGSKVSVPGKLARRMVVPRMEMTEPGAKLSCRP